MTTFWRLLAGLFVFALVMPAGAARISLEEKLEILVQSYPDHVTRVENNHLIMTDGTKIIIDDGQEKTHQQKLSDPDIEDMLSQNYSLNSCYHGATETNFDPGRIRVDAFFRSVYGTSSQAVSEVIVPVNWFGQGVRVTRIKGVNNALKKVAGDLIQLDPNLRKYFAVTAGTFNWRQISGTNRMSVHSFAAAIDINVEYGDYWRWAGGKPGNVPNYKNQIPMEVVEIFERHGFIWGGKWYHFDTIHFEYRPELIRIAHLASERGC